MLFLVDSVEDQPSPAITVFCEGPATASDAVQKPSRVVAVSLGYLVDTLDREPGGAVDSEVVKRAGDKLSEAHLIDLSNERSNFRHTHPWAASLWSGPIL